MESSDFLKKEEIIFGVIKKDSIDTVKMLLSWEEPEIKKLVIKNFHNNPEWISDTHDAFRDYSEKTQEKRPSSACPTGSNKAKKASKNKKIFFSPKPKLKKVEKEMTKGQKERIIKRTKNTRDFPDSSFKTYFGKPVFANYGQGNLRPASGGLFYGDYMKTHNIAPHEGRNNPLNQQVYENAERKGLLRPPTPGYIPRNVEEDEMSLEQLENLKQRSQIFPKAKEKPSKIILKPKWLLENNKNTKPVKKVEKIKENEEKVKENEEKKKKTPEIENFSKEIDSKPIQSHEEQKIALEDHLNIEKSKFSNKNPQTPTNNFERLIRTSYQDMTSDIKSKNNQIVKPFIYCAKCRDDLYSEDVMWPPYSLAEIPPDELNPKIYKSLHSQWTQRIPAAGKLSYRSPSAYQVIYG